jgi:uncharacterized protein
VTIIVDTGVLLAAINTADRWHAPCVELLSLRRREMIVPAAVIVETAWLVAKELGNTAEAEFIASIGRGEMQIENLEPVDYTRASQILNTYEDSNLGLVDTCVMAIAERHRAVEIATVNPRDFRIVRPAHCTAYTLLPEGLAIA